MGDPPGVRDPRRPLLQSANPPTDAKVTISLRAEQPKAWSRKASRPSTFNGPAFSDVLRAVPAGRALIAQPHLSEATKVCDTCSQPVDPGTHTEAMPSGQEPRRASLESDTLAATWGQQASEGPVPREGAPAGLGMESPICLPCPHRADGPQETRGRARAGWSAWARCRKRREGNTPG